MAGKRYDLKVMDGVYDYTVFINGKQEGTGRWERKNEDRKRLPEIVILGCNG